MSVVKRPGRSSVAFVVALTLLLAFVVPFVGTALAGHNTNHDLDCVNQDTGTETSQNQTGETHTIVCTVSGDPQTNVEVDFEITGANDPDGGDSPTTPDGTCNTQATSQCTFTFGGTGTGVNNSSAAGTSLVRAWIDDDQNNNTADGDMTEGRDETASGQGGAQTDPDDTDVVEKSWFAAFPANAALDCDDQSGDDEAQNPATGTGSTETYTCTLVDNGGTTGDDAEATADDTPIAGIRIDAENMGGANDPDNTDATPADFNDACTTDAQGRCTINIQSSEQQAGIADICFWADPDQDTQYAPGGDPNDGGECTESVFATELDDQADVVEKEWVAPNQPFNIDAEPESAQNQAGTTHTVTATVTDINGAPVNGAQVVFDDQGPRNDDDCTTTTNAQGQAFCVLNDAGNAAIPAGSFEQDTVQACATAGTNPCDTVEKFWFGQIPPTAEVIVDMETSNGCGTTTENLENNTVGSVHELCVTAEDANNVGIPGEAISVSLSGPGTFVDGDSFDDGDAQDTGAPTGSDNLGTSITVRTDSSGNAFVYVYSEQIGDSVITASADGKSDTGTKRWFENRARFLDCTPTSATNLVGTTHTVDCRATDMFGNPVSDAFVTLDEDGEGSVTDSDTTCASGVDDCAVTDQSGSAEFTVTSSNAGTQNLAFEFRGDRGDIDNASDNDNECDLPVGDAEDPDEDVPPENQSYGSPDIDSDVRATAAGRCEDTATKTWSTTITPTGGFPRDITLEASKNKVTYGNQVTLTAAVSAGSTDTPASCISGVTVTFQREIVGDDGGSEIIGTAVTDSNGEASLGQVGDRSANYVASVDQTAGCAQAASNPESVLVKKKVKLRVSDQTPRRGARVRFVVKVLPCGGPDGPGHEGDRVQLYKTVGGQLAKIAAKRTNDNCKAVFKKRVRGSATFQARSPKSDADHLGGKSRKKAVQTHR